MANTIKHQGIVENINGSHLQVRIIQTSACASCSVKGHCTSADTKEKLVDVADANAASYQPGDRVWVTGELSMGVMAVLFAFIFPFLILKSHCLSLWLSGMTSCVLHFVRWHFLYLIIIYCG